MSDQRIHQFKVFRGSSQAKARKQMSCSFISKPPPEGSQSDEPQGKLPVDGQGVLQQLQTDDQQPSQSDQQVEIPFGMDDTTKHTATPANAVNRDESLHFIYHEQDSGEEQADTQQPHDMGMNESSIHLNDSGWPAEDTGRLRLSIERMRLEEEKMKLELEKAELQRKRKEVELLMREVTIKKQTVVLGKSTETLNETREQTSNTTIQASRGTKNENSIQSQPSQTSKKRRSVRYRAEEGDEQKQILSKKEVLENKVDKLQKSQHLSRQQKARQALLLQTLWINLIKSSNQIHRLNISISGACFAEIKKASYCTRVVQSIESMFSLHELMTMGQAFIRIKKSAPVVRQARSPQSRRNLKVKFTHRQSKQNLFVEPLYSERSRVCQTQESRVLAEQSPQLNQTTQLSLTRSVEFEKGMFTGRASRTAEMDSIIRAQMHNNSKQNSRLNRGSSRQPLQATVKQIYLRSDAQQDDGKRPKNGATLTKIQIKNISTMLKPSSSFRRVL